MKKYPLYYYLILLIAFIFSALFWIFVFSKSINSIESNHSSIDESIYILKPIDKDKIINDEESKRKIGEKTSKSSKGEGNSQFGTRWIYSLELKISKKIK